MARIEVRYTASEFIQSCFGEGIGSAREYVAEHPKEFYGADDFAEVHRMQELKSHARYGPDEHDYCDNGHVGVGTWAEDDNTMERFVKIYEAD